MDAAKGETISGSELTEVQPTPDTSSYQWMLDVTDFLVKWLPFWTITIGLCGNTMSILVTTKKDNRKISTCVYMAALAVVDSFVLMIDGLYRITVVNGVGNGLEANVMFLRFIWYVAETFAIASGLFLAEMSVDRAIAVIYPMKAAVICTSSRAVKVVGATYVFQSVVHIQAFFIYDLPAIPNGAVIVSVPGAPWVTRYYNIYLLILGTVVPFSILVICNTIIIFGIRRASVERAKLESSQDKGQTRRAKEANLTFLLLMTSFVYLVLSCPKRIYEATTVYDMSNPYWSARYWFQFWLIATFWLMNFAINFYVYFLAGGKKFRNDAREVFSRICCCRKKV